MLRVPTLIALVMTSNLLGQAPTIVATYPSQNALNIALDATIIVTFDMDMDDATINAGTMVVQGHLSGLIIGNYNTVGTTATFTPTEPFMVGERVSVTITTGVQSSSETALSDPFCWDFTAEVLDGAGQYAAVENYDVGSNAYAVCAADLDGDGDVDLVVGIQEGYNIRVLLNDGLGNFTAGGEYETTNSYAYSIVAADLDSDGDTDIATAGINGSISVLMNNGAGRATQRPSIIGRTEAPTQ